MTDSSSSDNGDRSRLDPEPVARRDVLGMAAVGSALGALGFATLGMLQLPRPSVLPTPSRAFRVAVPESLAPGEPFVAPGRPVAVFRDADGTYAISLVCTHLGCIVKATGAGFDCPCHGSRFSRDGAVTHGPAPKGLSWLAVRSVGDGAYLIDEGTPVPTGTKEPA